MSSFRRQDKVGPCVYIAFMEIDSGNCFRIPAAVAVG